MATDLIRFFRYVVAAFALCLAACGGGGGGTSSPATSASTPASAPVAVTAASAPVARIGLPASVQSYATVTLDGSGSRSLSSTIQTYSWSQTSGTGVQIASPTSAKTTFVAPNVTTSTPLTFALTVTDGGGSASTTRTVNVLRASAAQLAPAFVDLGLFQTFDGNPHNNLLSLDGPPVIGSTLTVEATLSGAITAPTFTVVDAHGASLGNATLALSGNTALQPVQFIGTISVPSVPFTLRASGTSTDGQAYTLRGPVIFTPMNVGVSFVPFKAMVKPGTTTTTSLQIFNSGATATFTVALQDPDGLLAQAGTVSVVVAAGQTSSVPITLTLPAATTLRHPFVAASVSVDGDPSRTGTATFQVWRAPT